MKMFFKKNSYYLIQNIKKCSMKYKQNIRDKKNKKREEGKNEFEMKKEKTISF